MNGIFFCCNRIVVLIEYFCEEFVFGELYVSVNNYYAYICLVCADDYHENEEVLRQFDMNMAYGPCLGMTRLARWERACSLGLNPPKDVERLLREPHVRADCLWDGRI